MDPIVHAGPDCDCETAEEVLEKLRPTHSLWGHDPSVWLFRGHAESSWSLLATAHRRGAYAKFGVPPSVIDNVHQLWKAEQRILEQFHRDLDDVGLPIPARAPEVNPRGGESYYGGDLDHAAWPLRALAQHHGIPTAFLDWTRRAPIAAYFAASTAVDMESASGRMNIWALRIDLLDSMRENEDLRVFSAPRATNPNLRAQAGVFTILLGDWLCPLDEYLEKLEANGTFRNMVRPRRPLPPRPWLRRLSVPQACAPRLLRLLSYEGVSGSTMFPGYDGVVRAILERKKWDTPDGSTTTK
jgi:hypothetical protein